METPQDPDSAAVFTHHPEILYATVALPEDDEPGILHFPKSLYDFDWKLFPDPPI